VTVDVLAVFGPTFTNPVCAFGYSHFHFFL
jgi:hypothetical protein